MCLLCQVVGVAVAASGKWRGQAKDTGTGVLLFGLSAQLVIFSVYLAVLTLFCLRVRSGRAEEKSERVISVTGESDSFQDQGEKKRRDFGFNPLVKQVIKGMWIASVLVEVSSAITPKANTNTGFSGSLHLSAHRLCGRYRCNFLQTRMAVRCF